MKKNIKVTYETLSIICFLLFVIVGFSTIIMISSTDNALLLDKIAKYIVTFLIIDGTVGLLLLSINNNLKISKKDNVAFTIRRKFIKKYLNIRVLFTISMIFIVFLFIFVVGYDKLQELEYKDLVYSLNDNSDYENRITKKNSTKDYKSLDSNMFLGYRIDNKEVIDSYLCFIYDDKLTCLKKGKESFLKNKKKVEKVIGIDNCFEYQNYYKCSYNNYSISMNSKGSLNIMIEYSEDDKDYCVNQDNSFECHLIKDYD